MNVRILFPALATICLGSGAAPAHHSFAAFFDPGKLVTIRGEVTEFAFKNPHGLITLTGQEAGGPRRSWMVETNAPVVLIRRGWSRTAVKPGDTITVEGWPARNGKAYLRMRQAKRQDGSPIGVPFGQGDD